MGATTACSNTVGTQEREGRSIRINIGCGRTPTDGWQNFDNSLSLRLSRYPRLTEFLCKIRLLDDRQSGFVRFARSHDVRYANATKKIPFHDGTVDVLYSSHMMEHLDREEAKMFLAESRRVLRSDGILRLALPDLKKQVNAYLADQDADRLIFGTYLCQSRPRTLAARLRLLLMGTRNHQWMYDGPSLCRLLEDNGFRNPIVLKPGETRIPNPEDLNLRERESESVYVEAVAS